MTAIAWRDGIMAADTGEWGGAGSSVIVGHARKIRRMPDGSLFAATGSSGDIRRIAEHIAAGQSLDAMARPKVDDGFCAVWVKPGGEVWWIDATLFAFPIYAPFVAAGRPETFMLGALYAGATAEEAVRLAILYTDGAAGDVRVERL